MRLAPGTRLGSYEITGVLGRGGMGEVYAARDLKLSRLVAIKVLPQAVADDPDRLERFDREARLLASLNHPNIGAIYGLESLPVAGADPAAALVLELVDGESLGDRIAAWRTRRDDAGRVREAMTIARQIADALDAAHERGVIHRDLKPANIRITRDGVVKILDFGLAKAAPPADGRVDRSDSPTIMVSGTGGGAIVGTAAYMSPEQARGRTVDKRTDVWAFGCVVYEMITGALAFPGETTSDVLAAILEREPDFTRVPSATPPGVRRLLRRCLEKDVRRRLRDIADARAEIEDALAPAPENAVRPGADRSMPRAWLLIPAVVAAALVGAFVGRSSFSKAPDRAPAFDRVVRVVSSPAHEYGPAISPDGKWVAYLSNARGPTDVWVKFLSGGDPANLTAASGLDIQSNDFVSGLDVSPDGAQIAFTAQGQGQQNSAWVIPAPLGGMPRRVLAAGDFGLHWSRDGKHIAFVRTGGPLGDAIVVADPDGQNERVVAKREGAQHKHWIRWSADGQFIYFNYGPHNFNIEPTQIARVPVSGGAIEPVVVTARRAAFPFPSADGRGLVFASNSDGVDLSLWWRDLASGRDTRLTAGIGEYTHPVLSADGTKLAGTVIDARQSLERIAVALERPVQPEALTDGYTGDIDPVWSPDGTRLVFSSSRSGNRTLWSARPGMQQIAPVTSGSVFDERPAFSPDGQQVAFVSDRGGRRGIWVVSVEGGSPRFVGPAAVVDTIAWSPDGKRLVYATPVGDAPGLMLMTVADGNTSPLRTPAAATGPTWSSSDLIAYIEPRGGNVGAYPRIIRPDGTQVDSNPLDVPGAPQVANGALVWSADGTRLAASWLPGAGTGSVWVIDPGNAGASKKLLDLPSGVFIRGMTWARDGGSLIVGRYRWSGDIFLAERSAPNAKGLAVLPELQTTRSR